MLSTLTLLLLASLSFNSKNHDFGEVKEGQEIRKSFTIKNLGKKTIRILSVSSSCSCTIPSYSTEVKPAKTGNISIRFNTTGLSGYVERKVIVVTDDPEQEYYTITVKAYIKK